MNYSKILLRCPIVLICCLYTQVRLFLSEDAPCKSGLSAQDHLQAKDSWTMHASSGSTSDDSPLPPGFESVHNQNRPKTDISKIPLIRWKCPPKVLKFSFYCSSPFVWQTNLCVAKFKSWFTSIIISSKSFWHVNYR